MSGGFEDLQTDIRPELDLGAVGHRPEGVLRLGPGAEMDGRADPLRELEMTRHEVGMKVGQEDVANLERLAFGVLEILVDVALRVHDGRDAGRLVRDQVGGMGQTAEVVLFENHWSGWPLIHQLRSSRANVWPLGLGPDRT